MRISVYKHSHEKEDVGRGSFSACNYIHNELIYMYVQGDQE